MEMVSATRGWLAKQVGAAFLVAGGLLLVAAVIDAAVAFAGASISKDVSFLPAITGLVATYVALLGLYPRLAGCAPRLARVGLGLVSLPGLYFLAFMAKGVAGQFVAIPSPPPWVGLVLAAVVALFAVGVTLFGVVALRGEEESDTVGLLLLVVAAPWFAVLGWILVHGPLPTWMDVGQFGVMALAELQLGYLLGTAGDPLELSDSAPSSST